MLNWQGRHFKSRRMTQIDPRRIFHRNDREADPGGRYVLYWMQINRRFHYNYALDYAVARANELGKPLLIYEGLSCDYPWASVRTHRFIMEGMKEHLELARERGLNYFSYLEDRPGAGDGLLYRLASKSACVISDEYPVFIIRKHNEQVPGKLDVPYTTVDSNGIIPLGLTGKDPYSAYLFRKTMQKHFIEQYERQPQRDPLSGLENSSAVELPDGVAERYPSGEKQLGRPDDFIAGLPIRKEIAAAGLKGTRSAALGKLGQFVGYGLPEYEKQRNHPDEKRNSGLSPWLHFGKISAYEIVKTVLGHQPEGWDVGHITYNNGSTGGFFNGDPNVSAFLDELITWREVGFHFAHHRPDYAEFESLPGWALETLSKHASDPREYIYTFEELEQSQTHDEIWNAAQTELREEGTMHNYLRMLWGKKVMAWTPDPRTALDYLIELNNLYALDGRDPNSYSGIFWCFGRFDRAWQERPIYGKTRYMTSESTRRKLKMKEYLKRYG